MTTHDTTAIEALQGQMLAQTRRGDAIRARRNAEIRRLLSLGVTAYRIAQVTGMTERAIHKIRDDVTGARIDELVDRLERVLADAGITTIPRARITGPEVISRPYFVVEWVPDEVTPEMSERVAAQHATWGIDGATLMGVHQRCYSVLSDDDRYPAEDPRSWRAWLLDIVRDGPPGGHPVAVVPERWSWSPSAL